MTMTKENCSIKMVTNHSWLWKKIFFLDLESEAVTRHCFDAVGTTHLATF